MIPVKLPPLQQRSWKEELKLACKDPQELLNLIGLQNDVNLRQWIQHSPDFALLATRSYIQRIQPNDANDPLLLQILPLKEEIRSVSGYVSDPLMEKQAQLQPGLIKKYHGRALVITTGACAIHCRYCFRRHHPYSQGSAQIHKDWSNIIQALKKDTSIQEIILSGGDPLMLDTKKLQKISDDIQSISHIHTLRIHTRLPIVLPERITDHFCRWLEKIDLNKIIVIHSNHPSEINTDVAYGLKRIRQCDATLLNQSVLLRGINDNADVLESLSWKLIQNQTLPYYLHDLDPVSGAHHFSIPHHKVKTLQYALLNKLPGYLVPKFVREIPTHPYKTPLNAIKHSLTIDKK